ncbi:alpha/beta fold hydrolase [Nocardioides piscis]|uniref:Alpha/beta fold hydrolase n=1 Tax=Nocardioides piscis TaxID=2714938 RepID=A0A6G7YH14_9ACTN|nr:alpha/beta fold hydrolase [Nocardioides piscis]QIK75928.1 alpha/beta fold hydrolase [Nocardioides piscis]
MPAPSLQVTELGERGSRIAFCHGLFGQGRNWTQIGKALAADHRVTLIDMPNHGESGWTQTLSYPDMADAVAELFTADDPVALVGHSMGGKAAMMLALRHPELVERLAVVDVSPVSYETGRGEFADFIQAMRELDLGSIESRGDADTALAPAVPNRTVRSFLLQNLRRDGDGWRWQLNLELLGNELDALGGWPETDEHYDGPVLWIGGANSDYVLDEHAPAMERHFPLVRRVTVKDAGHWVHSERPEVVLEVLRRFVD